MTDKVAELTVDELRELLHSTIRELVEEIIEERMGMLIDPDDDLELRPEVVDTLQEYLESNQHGDDADDVFRELGLD